jgi:hypothetical protein
VPGSLDENFESAWSIPFSPQDNMPGRGARVTLASGRVLRTSILSPDVRQVNDERAIEDP